MRELIRTARRVFCTCPLFHQNYQSTILLRHSGKLSSCPNPCLQGCLSKPGSRCCWLSYPRAITALPAAPAAVDQAGTHQTSHGKPWHTTDLDSLSFNCLSWCHEHMISQELYQCQSEKKFFPVNMIYLLRNYIWLTFSAKREG